MNAATIKVGYPHYLWNDKEFEARYQAVSVCFIYNSFKAIRHSAASLHVPCQTGLPNIRVNPPPLYTL